MRLKGGGGFGVAFDPSQPRLSTPTAHQPRSPPVTAPAPTFAPYLSAFLPLKRLPDPNPCGVRWGGVPERLVCCRVVRPVSSATFVGRSCFGRVGEENQLQCAMARVSQTNSHEIHDFHEKEFDLTINTLQIF